MGQVIGFEESAVARLRDRLGMAENARADLVAYARDHSGAQAAIHAAVLSALDAHDMPGLIAIVTREWPALLGVECVALAVVIGDRAFRADHHGISEFSKPVIDRSLGMLGDVTMRGVGRGHPMFGDEGEGVRAEALIRLDSPHPMPYGLLAIGQCEPLDIDAQGGNELLLFLGASLAAMIRRCVDQKTTS
jgi:uncharacterized protein YigA (DUF484 family)